MKHKQRLIAILKDHPWFAEALSAVSQLQLPQWCIGAGIIRNIVFDHLHHLPDSRPRDVDVAYFDPDDLSRNVDRAYEARLYHRMPTIPWEVTNQAGVHLWYPSKFGYEVEPLTSIEDAVATWPETCTCVGVTLSGNRKWKVYAPYGLGDLFAMTIRRNPRRIDLKTYNKRIREKKYTQIWRAVRVIHEPTF